MDDEEQAASRQKIAGIIRTSVLIGITERERAFLLAKAEGTIPVDTGWAEYCRTHPTPDGP